MILIYQPIIAFLINVCINFISDYETIGLRAVELSYTYLKLNEDIEKTNDTNRIIIFEQEIMVWKYANTNGPSKIITKHYGIKCRKFTAKECHFSYAFSKCFNTLIVLIGNVEM